MTKSYIVEILKQGHIVERKVLKKELMIGRSEEADVFLDDDKISRRHCRIVLIDGDVFLEDLNSKNGIDPKNKAIKSVSLKEGSPFSFFIYQIMIYQNEFIEFTITRNVTSQNG